MSEPTLAVRVPWLFKVICAVVGLLFAVFGIAIWIATEFIWPGRTCVKPGAEVILLHGVLLVVMCGVMLHLLRNRPSR